MRTSRLRRREWADPLEGLRIVSPRHVHCDAMLAFRRRELIDIDQPPNVYSYIKRYWMIFRILEAIAGNSPPLYPFGCASTPQIARPSAVPWKNWIWTWFLYSLHCRKRSCSSFGIFWDALGARVFLHLSALPDADEVHFVWRCLCSILACGAIASHMLYYMPFLLFSKMICLSVSHCDTCSRCSIFVGKTVWIFSDANLGTSTNYNLWYPCPFKPLLRRRGSGWLITICWPRLPSHMKPLCTPSRLWLSNRGLSDNWFLQRFQSQAFEPFCAIVKGDWLYSPQFHPSVLVLMPRQGRVGCRWSIRQIRPWHRSLAFAIVMKYRMTSHRWPNMSST